MQPGGPSIGDAYVDIHANTSPYDRELRRGLQRASDDADDLLDDIGEQWGDRLADSVSDEISTHGRDFGRAIERATDTVRVRVRGRWDIDNNVVRDVRGRFMRRLEQEVEEAIVSASTPGGPFNRLGTAISDAIGAGFNISGRSPLIAFLIPVIGYIIALVAAALQAINALVAVVATLPALLAAIGVQAAIVMIAFQGMGEAIQGALAAKNAKELNEALKNLTPSAQDFVKQILSARSAFRDIQRSIQEQFFGGLGNIIGPLIRVFDPITMSRVSVLARDLGEFFRGIALFFASPTFKEFLNEVLPATSRFLRGFGPSFVTFLTGLIKFAEATLPFLSALGDIASSLFEGWGKSLERIAKDRATQKWFSDMEDTLQSVRALIGSVVEFVAVFLAKLNEAGGIKIIDELTKSFEQLVFLLSSPVGEEFMKGLVEFSVFAIQVFTGLVEFLIFIVAAIRFSMRAVGEFFEFIGLGVMAVFDAIFKPIAEFVAWLYRIFTGVGEDISEIWPKVRDRIIGAIQGALDFFKGIKDKIKASFADAGDLLFGAGRNIVGGLISGIKSAIPSMIKALNEVAATIPQHKGPEEKDKKLLVPAGKAVMEGFTTGLKAGSTDVKAMLTDFTSSLGGFAISSNNSPITFGRDSIRISFEGALPTQEQARSTGTAVGAGISGMLAQRNARLAVRTL